MAVTSTPIFPQTPQDWPVQILPANTTAQVTLVTAGANGSKVEMLNVASTDTSARVVQLFINDGSTSYLLCTVNIPANAGNTSGTVSVDLLNIKNNTTGCIALPYDTCGNQYLYVKNGYTLKVASLTTVTTAKALNFLAMGGDF